MKIRNRKPVIKFILTEVTKNKSFTTVSFLPLAKMSFYHNIEKHKGKQIKITHCVEITGILACIFSFLIGRTIKKGLPTALANLITLAEQ